MGYENRKEEWNQMKNRLRMWVSDSESAFQELPDEIKADLGKMIGKTGIRQSVSNVNDKIRLTFIEKGELSLMEIFTEFEIGKEGMKAFIKSSLLRKNAEEWVWVNYDEKTKTYSMVGRGPEVPEGYTGWVPKEMREL